MAKKKGTMRNREIVDNNISRISSSLKKNTKHLNFNANSIAKDIHLFCGTSAGAKSSKQCENLSKEVASRIKTGLKEEKILIRGAQIKIKSKSKFGERIVDIDSKEGQEALKKVLDV